MRRRSVSEYRATYAAVLAVVVLILGSREGEQCCKMEEEPVNWTKACQTGICQPVLHSSSCCGRLCCVMETLKVGNGARMEVFLFVRLVAPGQCPSCIVKRKKRLEQRVYKGFNEMQRYKARRLIPQDHNYWQVIW
ncbi:hypothetical protein E2C01_097897 [Portunus trituberculatus]|uniref:Secreted protein n=1 Tax=Portunus trituberculatus TaxID=210409 RepID=A0A5B7K5K1_PORTR|nr:hypothetical protein [Portunus trituberculatus]